MDVKTYGRGTRKTPRAQHHKLLTFRPAFLLARVPLRFRCLRLAAATAYLTATRSALKTPLQRRYRLSLTLRRYFCLATRRFLRVRMAGRQQRRRRKRVGAGA